MWRLHIKRARLVSQSSQGVNRFCAIGFEPLSESPNFVVIHFRVPPNLFRSELSCQHRKQLQTWLLIQLPPNTRPADWCCSVGKEK
jgi:hypothetical protein